MNATLKRLLLGIAGALCLCGCFPEERVWWSPLGDRAVVLIDGRLHLANASGELGEALTTNATTGQTQIKSVSWLPDGTGFVCHLNRVVHRWVEVRALIPAAEATAVEEISPAVMPLLEVAVKLDRHAKTLEDGAASLQFAQELRLLNAMRRLFELDPSGVEKWLMALPKGRDIAAGLKESGYEVSELCVFKLTAGSPAESVVIERSMLHPVMLPRVSPRQDAVAYLRLAEEGKSAALEVITLDGRSRLTVARNVSAAFDWLPDGRSLVFMAPIGGEGEKLQSIHRIAVLQENGALMKPRDARPDAGSAPDTGAADQVGEPVTLATAITLNRPALQALADSRVLFASQPATLPAAGTGPALDPRLFLISADGQSVQPVPTVPGDLPTNLAYFAASPDGKHISVVEGETDAVAVVEVRTGKTQIISPAHPRWQCRTLPAWKSATELTFAALHDKTGEPAWKLWSEDGQVRWLSEKWPAGATANWLELKKPEPSAAAATSKPAPSR